MMPARAGLLERGALLVLVTGALVLVLTGLPRTTAAFTDSASIRSGTFASGAVQPVTGARCADPSGTSAVVRWTNVDTRYSYLLEAVRADGTVLGSTLVLNNGTSGTVQQLEISPGDLDLPPATSYRLTDFVVRVRSQLTATNASPSPWRGSVVEVPIAVSLVNILLLFPTTHVQCG
ncbi:hypothetical protein [Nocardioides sp. SYSU DS0663]|uniref:hypothetical protein n=1 Tax=Nocardioides sp. SYSU DS0663 TaxID=3416445 RepID=UPI003F4B99C4